MSQERSDAHLSRSTSVAAGGQPSSKDSASGELRLFGMSLEIRRVELQLEPTYPRVDLDLSAPGHSWQVAGRRACPGLKASRMFAAGERNVKGCAP
jgi:hypothetical protein